MSLLLNADRPLTAAPPTRVRLQGDRVLVTAKRVAPTPAPAPAKPKPAPSPAPAEEGEKGVLHRFWDLMFGNVENKLFQIKFNLIYFKDAVLAFSTAAQAGPFGPLFTFVDKVGGLASGVLTRLRGTAAAMAQRSANFGKLYAWFGRAAAPLRAAGAVTLKWLERSAPLFGWLVAVQDLITAIKRQGEAQISGGRKVLSWATFGFSAIGATASTIAAWCTVGAAASAPTGIGPVGLGTIAIACFGLSLLCGWLGGREPAKPALKPAQ